MALSSNIEIFRRSEEQLRHENSNLKELINSIESERIHYRAISEQLQKDLAYSKKESASFAANESKLLAYIKPDQQPQYQAPRYDEYYGPSDGNEMANYQYLLPRNEIEGTNTPPRFPAEAYYPAPEEYKQPRSQTSSQDDKSPLKLPMHLASSVSFDYPDQFDQYYKKNQAAGPPPAKRPVVDNKIREGAQKAYFGSNLDNVFDWDNGQKAMHKIPQNHPSAETAQGSQQFPQGSQGPEPTLARELTQTIPPKSQMNKQQIHLQIMKLENALLTFQMDQDRNKAELQKIPESHRLNHNQQQKKKELERNLEVLDKNINTVKLKLRDIKL